MRSRYIRLLTTIGLAAVGSSALAQSFIPGGIDTAGYTYVLPDMLVWYNINDPVGYHVSTGKIPDPSYQLATTFAATACGNNGNGNWEPYISVMGDTTFLIGAGMFADDGTWQNPCGPVGGRPNQRYIVVLQPVSGQPPVVGEAFYDDFGQPYRLHEMMRQRNPGVRVAGDKRAGAATFMAGGTAALCYGNFWYGTNYFNTDGRYSTTYPLYGTGFGSTLNQDGFGTPPGTTDFQGVSVQTFSLNPGNLQQTQLCKAMDPAYGKSWRDHTPTEFCNNLKLACGDGGAGSDNQSYFGGDIAALDNGNYVVVVNDYTGFLGGTVGQPAAVATIVAPDGSVVKDTWLIDAREIWANVAAYKGGFCARVQDKFYFFKNDGTPSATNTIASSGVGFDTGRGDGTRLASDIRSSFVYLAGPATTAQGPAVQLGIWNATNGVFVTNVVVSSDMDPTVFAPDRVNLGVDLSDRICVAYAGKPDKNQFANLQIVARVMQFNRKLGTNANVTFLTPSFFPFKCSDTTNNLGAAVGFLSSNPSVAMTKDAICIAAKGISNTQGDPTMGADTGAETTMYTIIAQPFVPGSLEGQGMTRLVPDTVVPEKADGTLPSAGALGNWEPYTSVLGTSTFLIEGNTYALLQDGSEDIGDQRFVVAFQPAAGGAMKLGEAFFSDNGQPFRLQINTSRENGNPGRVAGDKRPGATNFIAGAETTLYRYPDSFNSDGRFDTTGKPFYTYLASVGQREGAVQLFSLNPTNLVQTMRSVAQDSAYGRCCVNTTPDHADGGQISRFGGELACLDNGNFVSVVEDRSGIFNPNAGVPNISDYYAVVATIFAPDGSIVKEAFKVADGDIWSNVAAYRGGFAVRCRPTDQTNTRWIYFFDNAGNLKGHVDQAVTGKAYDTGRGDGTRIAGHINSPYVFLVGSVGSPTHLVPLSVFDSRDSSFVTSYDVTEVGFEATADRVGLAVDALNRVVISWTSQPTGYLQSQVAARVLGFNESTKLLAPLTHSFWSFINTCGTNNIHSLQMNPSMTTKQILIAAKGEINLQNHPENDANSQKEVNFYTVFTHPDPQNDPTPPVGGITTGPTMTVSVSGTTLTISWPTTFTGFTLESKNAFTDPSWTAVGTANPAVITIGPGNKFFRLRK